MCLGDDVNCPDFEAHFQKFKEEINPGRRGFLGAGLMGAGGIAAFGATGGLSLVTPALAETSARNGPSTPSYHYLPANSETVHWGYFSKTLKPQVEVDSGDIVTIETLTHHAGDDMERMVQGDEGAESVYLWTKDKKGVDRRGAGSTDPSVYKIGSGDGKGVHILTGPVYVRGAEPGDVLEVRILDCAPRPCANPEFTGRSFGSNAAAAWGYHYNDMLNNAKREVITIYEVDATGHKSWAEAVYNFKWVPQTDPFGVTHKTIDYPGVPVDHSLTSRNFDVLKGIRIPIRPHFGTLGVAPAEADFVDSVPPSYTGGNVDNWRIGKGATMYYPVSVDGALLSVGDPHASQGDSELCGTAIECSLTGTFQLILHKKADLGGTPLEEMDHPMLETQTEWLVHGFSVPNYLDDLGPTAQSDIYGKSSIDGAMRDAFRKMRKFLMTTKGLTEDEAHSLMSVGVDFGITQVVDGNWGVHAIVKKDLFSGRA
ncbi:Acetamidase/formamidase [Pseudooceanicola antarcticus]|uniref:Acetamidase n=1 Tax=Pseudooceanicola antarcticus TaxID=1247613 RepID=A0A285JIY7_9RHOB|nr:acetamidase/formamidase family protein [Pseudooceanicola antarcticus]PJE26396.1 acetamidase [Pseudooceanicola antarcticus]SNY59346.1 Acetamidase/formamidase [Pseudooceanicola antarcticus]